jgi:hypothetical protein
VAYCMQTYRSYDPQSGTYLGYDGLRYPCPYHHLICGFEGGALYRRRLCRLAPPACLPGRLRSLT